MQPCASMCIMDRGFRPYVCTAITFSGLFIVSTILFCQCDIPRSILELCSLPTLFQP